MKERVIVVAAAFAVDLFLLLLLLLLFLFLLLPFPLVGRLLAKKKKNLIQIPSVSRTFRYHLGTLAFGSLIISIIRMIRVMIEYVQEKLKEYGQVKTISHINKKNLAIIYFPGQHCG